MKLKLFFTLMAAGMLLSIASCGRSISSSDANEIKQVCADYTAAFYSSDEKTLTRVLHPQFIKMNTEGNIFETINLKDYIHLALRQTRPQPQIKISVIDVFKGIASASIESTSVEYVHLVKTDGHWQIASILWEYNLIK